VFWVAKGKLMQWQEFKSYQLGLVVCCQHVDLRSIGMRMGLLAAKEACK
jgi:hypothetical protein